VKLPIEFKVMRVRECVSEPALIDTPERAVEYWHANIPHAEWFDPDKEAFIVMVLNTRRRILGHNLVTLGTLDTCTGNPTPSEADIKVTRDLIRAGQLLKIERKGCCPITHNLNKRVRSSPSLLLDIPTSG
jgi:DNA repair protein RadC